MPRRMSQSGRTRIAITVVLVVLIGGVGAFLLPVLVHETRTPTPTTFRAEVTFAVPAEGLPRGAPLRVTARLPGGRTLTTTEPMPANASGKAVVGMIVDGIADAGWPEAARPQIVSEMLAFRGLAMIGSTRNRAGVPVALAVSGRPGQSLTLRLGLEGKAGDGTDRLVVALEARAVVGTADDAVAYPGIMLQIASNAGAKDILGGLLDILHEKGWAVDMDETGALLLNALPEETPIGSAILTVGTIEGSAPTSERLWTIELVP